MKFIVDAQLQPGLAVWLREQGEDAHAARDIGLREADDRTIWDWAVQADAVIITKDQDFAIRRGAVAVGPAILWLRVGNTVNRHLLARFAKAWPMVKALLEEGQSVVEVR